MKQKTFTVLFIARKAKQLKNGEIPIYLRVTVNGTREEISTYQSVEVKKWDSKRGIAKGNGKKENELNHYLDAVKANLLKIHRQLEIDNEVITAKLIVGVYTGKINPQKSLIEVFKEHNKKCRELIDKNEMVEKTVQRYERTVRYLQEYMKEVLNTQDILLNKITPSFLTDFEHFLKSRKGCAHNSAKKYLKCIRTIIINALANGWIKKDPYVSVDMVEQRTTPVFLTLPEIEKIMRQEFISERLNITKDVFLFCCFTGLAFSDIKTLERNHIDIDEDDQLWIRKERVKTKIRFNVPLIEIPLLLLEKYENHPTCQITSRLFPIPSNQKMNEYLKEIANICGIHKNLSTHCARHLYLHF